MIRKEWIQENQASKWRLRKKVLEVEEEGRGSKVSRSSRRHCWAMASQSQHQPVDLSVVRTRVPVGPGNRLMSHWPELAEAAPGAWPPGWDGGARGHTPLRATDPQPVFPAEASCR